MSVAIHLDRPHKHLTNLDYLTGKVILTLQSETSVAGIQVKLEAESRTRLAGPKYPHNEHSDKKRTELEVHKVCLFSTIFYALLCEENTHLFASFCIR